MTHYTIAIGIHFFKHFSFMATTSLTFNSLSERGCYAPEKDCDKRYGSKNCGTGIL
jgi:hypothetical protein